MRPWMRRGYILGMTQLALEFDDPNLSPCCEAYTTYMEVGTDEQGEVIWGLCCKACYGEIK